MPSACYLCDVCETSYTTEAEAAKCEKEHPEIESFKLSHIYFRKADSLYGTQLYSARKFPEKIILKRSDKFGDQATYKLERIGPRGV